MIADAGVDYRLTLPSKRFNRKMGIYANRHFDPEGRPISDVEFHRRSLEWLPSEADRAYIKSLMLPVAVLPTTLKPALALSIT
jgi:benzoyl-CoA 2,3-dioxygenase component B